MIEYRAVKTPKGIEVFEVDLKGKTKVGVKPLLTVHRDIDSDVLKDILLDLRYDLKNHGILDSKVELKKAKRTESNA